VDVEKASELLTALEEALGEGSTGRTGTRKSTGRTGTRRSTGRRKH
jgi:hypothetical protein